MLKQLSQFDEPILFVGTDTQKFTNEIKEVLHEAEINKVLEWDLPNGCTIATLGANREPVRDLTNFVPRYLKKVEAEEKWLETHTPGDERYVEKI